MKISSETPQPEAERRQKFLEALIANKDARGLRFNLQEHSFTLSGPASAMKPEQYTGASLAAYVNSRLQRLTEHAASLPMEFETGEIQPTPRPSYITVMTGARHSLHYAGSFAAGKSVSSLAFLENHRALFATDSKLRLVRKWRLRDNILESAGQRQFPGEPRQGSAVPFNPHQMVVGPNEKWIALLEQKPFFPDMPRFAILKTEDLSIQWMVDLPAEVANCLSGSWSEDGNTLVLGCSARRMRGKSSLAVLLYHFQDGEPRLYQLIDLPHGKIAPPSVPALAWNTHANELYLFQAPHQNLIRYASDRTSNAILETMPFGSGPDTETSETYYFRLNRTRDHGILSGAGPSRTWLHLISFQEDHMVLADRFTTGFRPAAILRIPMTDRFWVTGHEKGIVAIVRISANKLELESQTPLTDFKPSLMASDAWGDLLFLATNYEPAPIYE